MVAAIENLETAINTFQPDRFLFDIDRVTASGLKFRMDVSKESAISDTAANAYPLFIKANSCRISNINVAYSNKITKISYVHHLEQFSLSSLNFDMAAQKFIAGDIKMDNSSIVFNFYTPAAKPAAATPAAFTAKWEFKISNVDVHDNALMFNNTAISPAPGLDVNHIDLQKLNIKVQNLNYSKDRIAAAIKQLAFKDKSGFLIDSAHANINYSNKGVKADDLYVHTANSILQNSFAAAYDSIGGILSAPAHTAVNASLDKTIIAVNDLYLLMPSIKKYLPENKFKGNQIQLTTNLNGTLAELHIPTLQVKGFAGSSINAGATLYNITDPNKLGYDIIILNSSLLKQDIVKWMPPGKLTLSELPTVINISTHLKGNLKNSSASINIKSKSISLDGKGIIKNIGQPKNLQYDIRINHSSIHRSFIEAAVPTQSIPANIQLPEIFSVRGTAKGDVDNIHTNATLSGSYGTAMVNGYVKNMANPETAVYDISFSTKNFQAGKLVRQGSILGSVSLSGTAKGRGFNYKTMNTLIDGSIDSIELQDYEYKNILLHAKLKDGTIKSNGAVNDSNIRLNYLADINLHNKYPAGIFHLRMDTIQLKQLNLYADTLNTSFTIDINAQNLDPDNMNFYAAIDSSKIMVKQKRFLIDSIRANAKNNNGVNTFYFQSPVGDLSVAGNFNFQQIGPSMLRQIDEFYNISDTAAALFPPQQLSFNGVIKKSEIITTLFPGLDYDSIIYSGNYQSDQSDSAIKLAALIPKFIYKTNRLSNGRINISSPDNELKGVVLFDTLAFGSNLFYKTSLTASATGDSISISALTKDIKNKDRYILGANILKKEKTYSVSIKDSLLLNYKSWNVAPGNRITYSKNGILVTNFILSSDSTKIAASSRSDSLNSPIDVSIANFRIRDITSLLNNDTLLVSGNISGNFSVAEFDKKLPAFTGNLQVDSLQFMQQQVGNIELFAKKQEENIITASMKLTGNNNDVTLKGNYYLDNDDRQFNADLNIANLNMMALQAFSIGNLSKSAGGIKGQLILDGKFTEPHWNGELFFDSTSFSIVKTGVAYSMNKQRITFQYPEILFPNVIISDSAGHQFRTVGTIRSKSISAYDFNVGIDAKKFTLLNVSKAIANQVYGFVAIDADIKITGNSAAPSIEGNLFLNDKSDVTMILPETNVNRDAAKTVVRFIDRDTFDLPEKIKFSPEKEIKPSFAQFLNYNLNLEVNKDAALTIIIDPSSGDELKIQGKAQLNAGVDPGGNIILAGNYELNSGYYLLNYQFLHKRFNLMPGSTIVFSGAPTDAQIDITAEYIANTSARDLIGNEVGEVDPKLAARFKQEIPFRVLLMMKGSMKKPEISFNIEMPDENTAAINNDLRSAIENKLVQLRENVAATNKQVFSLLLLNRFVGEQSSDFFKGSGESGGGFNDVARESVSKFLSSALDNIAEDLFKGLDVDLNLDTYKDYSTGDEQQKTDLNIAVTKNFVNDRLSITVGKSFGVEGQDANARASRQQGTGFLPDVTINYKLTQDGKYLLRAYKKNQFEVIMDGYVIETGVAFVVTLDYDKFRELFVRTKTSSKTK